MARQRFLIYDDTTPFEGYIYPKFVGKIDLAGEDHTHQDYIEGEADSSASKHLVYLPFAHDLPDSEVEKYDIATQTLVPLEPQDITPKAAYEAELDGLKSNMIDLINSTSYSDVDDIIDTQFSDHTAGQRNVLKKLTYIALHYGKRSVR